MVAPSKSIRSRLQITSALDSESGGGIVTVKSQKAFDEGFKVAGEGVHVIAWVAGWCRKCIYLKPKLRNLLTEYSDLPYMFVEVNEVPGAVVKKGGVKKLPTIQVWKGETKMHEVIGGEKGDIVCEKVKAAIDELLAAQ